jgi:hypothetical protein
VTAMNDSIIRQAVGDCEHEKIFKKCSTHKIIAISENLQYADEKGLEGRQRMLQGIS